MKQGNKQVFEQVRLQMTPCEKQKVNGRNWLKVSS